MQAVCQLTAAVEGAGRLDAGVAYAALPRSERDVTWPVWFPDAEVVTTVRHAGWLALQCLGTTQATSRASTPESIRQGLIAALPMRHTACL